MILVPRCGRSKSVRSDSDEVMKRGDVVEKRKKLEREALI